MPVSLSQPDQAFSQDLDHAFQGLRGALTELLGSVDAQIDRPQEIARRFGLNKNLAWKLSKISAVTDPHAVLSNLPGAAGMETILSALRAGGAPLARVEQARRMIDRFDRMVETHVGDRSTLQLVLSSMEPDKVPIEHLHKTRKLSFQGNSCVWGIQARVRMASFFIAPNRDDPEQLDTASLGGLIGVRRLRPDASVPLMMRFAFNDDGSPMDQTTVEPIDPSRGDDELMLMPEFCSTPLPAFIPIPGRGYTRYQLAPGPIGNGGLNTWVHGECSVRFAPIYRDAHNRFGEHCVPIQTPVQWLQCDLQIHRSLAFALDPRALLVSQLSTGPWPSINTDTDCDRLPLIETLDSIGHSPPVVATPLIPNYSAMVQRVYERMGWKAVDFVGYRIAIKYPPLATALVIQHNLADPPGAVPGGVTAGRSREP